MRRDGGGQALVGYEDGPINSFCCILILLKKVILNRITCVVHNRLGLYVDLATPTYLINNNY